MSATAELYLDANATTPVLPAALSAAQNAMTEAYGNPSSVHCAGLRAKALMESVRASARRVLGAGDGKVLFVSGATEGIQTAVLSALVALRERRARGEPIGSTLLYGATEHKAVPETLKHWNQLLGLNLEVKALPVDSDGRHDLSWLREQAPACALLATMAANNETGVVSDLPGLEAVLNDSGSAALWLVDGVQALGKLPLMLAATRIDYAPFSGHKLYAPKGVGLLYVRAGAPYTPLMAGGGQEGGLRSGTESMSSIAALGAVLNALEAGDTFTSRQTQGQYREQLAAALRDAFPGIVFNAPFELTLPTTLNFSVPGFASKELLDLFDAAQMRVSSGSACSANKALPSFVLEAMQLPAWRAASAVRLSFGPAAEPAFIEEACRRIRACGQALRRSALLRGEELCPAESGVYQFNAEGACCWLLTDAASQSCIIIDPLEELALRLETQIRSRDYRVLAILDTHSHADHASPRLALLERLRDRLADNADTADTLGWPDTRARRTLRDGRAVPVLTLGEQTLAKLPLPGHTADSVAYLLNDSHAFVGDTVLIGGLGRTDFVSSSARALFESLHSLAAVVSETTLLCPAHDYDFQFATTLAAEKAAGGLLAQVLCPRAPLSVEQFITEKTKADQGLNPPGSAQLLCGATRCQGNNDEQARHIQPEQLAAFLAHHPDVLWLDVREAHEHALGKSDPLRAETRNVPLTRLAEQMAQLLKEPRPLLLVCRSGSRSHKAAQALRRLGLTRIWDLAGGLAHYPPVYSQE